jgi:CBS domain-containing protein
MQQPVLIIDAGARVDDAVRLMRERGVRHLPVLDADEGGARDLLRALQMLLRERVGHPRPTAATATAGVYDPGIAAVGDGDPWQN